MANLTTVCLGDTITFTDSTTNNPTSWNWDFGDGNSSTAQNPTHVYATAGTYDVKLVVTNAYNSDSITKTGYIMINAPPSTDVSFNDTLYRICDVTATLGAFPNNGIWEGNGIITGTNNFSPSNAGLGQHQLFYT